MGEDFDPSASETVRPVSARGILVAMGALIAIGTAAGFIFGGTPWGVGVALGGALAFGNYLWLERSTRAVFRQEAVATAGILAGKYILRYLALGAILLLIAITDILPIAAVIAGLGAFAAAVIFQGFKGIFTTSI